MSTSADEIRRIAAETRSSSVVVWQDGSLALDWSAGSEHERIVIQSVTKLVTGIGVAIAFGDDVGVLDEPLARRWLPEWRTGAKSGITLRHILTHSTGLAAPPPSEIYALDDIVRGALDAPVTRPPGRFAYNNLVINLAGEIVRRKTGSKLPEFMADRVFGRLGFRDWFWRVDPQGNTHCFGDLHLRADDLVKLGRLLLEAADAAVPDPWRVEIVPKTDVGLTCFARHAWVRYESNSLDLPLAAPDVGPTIGFGHDGDQGQHLVVLPEARTVAVRLRAWEAEPPPGTGWPSFAADVWHAVTS